MGRHQLNQLRLNGHQVVIPSWHSHPKAAHIIITAGMDGDEYEGIAAAHNLISHFEKHPPAVPLTIIPLLNPPGFSAGVSFNPLDHKFPKYIFPGKSTGTPTEKLLFWLTNAHVFKAKLWLNLHGGDANESLSPFVWTAHTGVTAVDRLISQVTAGLSGPLLIESDSSLVPTHLLAQKHIGYILVESGDGKRHNQSDIFLHETIVKHIIHAFTVTGKTSPKPTFTQTHFTLAPRGGLWYPRIEAGQQVFKGQELGLLSTTSMHQSMSITTKFSGTILWHKNPYLATKTDTLVALGR